MPVFSQYDVPDANTMVNLGVGQPDTSKLPIDWFNNTLEKLSKQKLSPEFLQYGAIPGYSRVRNKLANWLTSKYYDNLNVTDNINVSHIIKENQIFMTNGNTGALQIIMNTMMETGDEIIIEDPTYFIAKKMFEEYGLTINSVSMEDDGLNVNELEERIKNILQNNREYPQNKIFLYTIPIHHNPTSITLTHEKRKQIADLCVKYPNFYVIADEVYHFLSFENKLEVYPMADYHPKILSLGSFSKLLAPGLRVGWIYQNIQNTTHYNLIDIIQKCSILDSSGSFNPLGYLFLESALDDGSLDKIINKNIEILKERCYLMCEYLNVKKSDIEFLIPKGGYFLWLKMNIDDTTKFLDFAINYKVKFHPGIKFGETSGSYIRLSFSYYNSDDLIIGIERLVDAYLLYRKIKVSICGSTGKLGSLIVNELEKNTRFYMMEPIKREIFINPDSDVIIDVSSKEGTHNLIKYLITNKINKPIIIGTTGLSEETSELIRSYSISNAVALISNFSEGIPKIKKILEQLNKLSNEWNFSMVEKHHVHKKDSPSGTAKTLTSLIERECNINAIREGSIIGFHEIKLESPEEEIIISHSAKTRNIFAKGCIRYIPWIIKQNAGIYYEMTYEKPEYEIYSIDNQSYLVTENNDLMYIQDISKKITTDYYTTIKSIDDKTFEIKSYDSNLNLINYSINSQKSVAKYINKHYNTKVGVIKQGHNNINFKFENKNIILEVFAPQYFQLKDSYSQNLTVLINQLSGINVVGVSKYIFNDNHLIIEINKDVNELDSEMISTLGNIINSEKNHSQKYNVHFVSISSDKKISIRSYDKTFEKENFSSNGCVIAFDYYTFNDNFKFDSDTSYSFKSNDKNIMMFYHNDKYFYSE
jgi:2-aminoadipate transaminase